LSSLALDEVFGCFVVISAGKSLAAKGSGRKSRRDSGSDISVIGILSPEFQGESGKTPAVYHRYA
jgi:hypothetical protein